MTHIATLQTGRAHPHPEPISGASYSAVELMPVDRTVVVLDQRKLPRQERYELVTRVEQIAEAITSMMVRGAPAIGITAAYGMVLAAGACDDGEDGFRRAMAGADALLRATRPTAVNLAWALDEMAKVVVRVASRPPEERVATMGEAARDIHRADVVACRKIGALGAAHVKDGATILTHCNAGALATGGYGTALGVIRAAHALGKRVRVLADETRPLLQGARLTAWELKRDGIPVEVVTDSMAASLFAQGAIDQVVVGADRVARSGDVANKIGTYGVACLAHLHGVPFDVAAPFSTVDLACPSGKEIPIEQRKEQEVTHMLFGDQEVALAPDGVRARNPAFDVTPARLVRALYTERGTVSPVNEPGVAALGGAKT